MTPEQISAFNQAVTDFTAGQTLQQAGDNAGALVKYEAALPAIRTAVTTQPTNIDTVNFLANALYAAAAANGALAKPEAMLALFEEAVPHWRTVLTAKPTDSAGQAILAGMLIQLGNAKLVKQDKVAATALYNEATTLARGLIAAKPTDAPAKNLLLAALIGNSQASADKKLLDEAVAMSKSMLADGTVDATNKPNAQILAGNPPQK
jgi:tetratricopeptide (TPR) repeat protein